MFIRCLHVSILQLAEWTSSASYSFTNMIIEYLTVSNLQLSLYMSWSLQVDNLHSSFLFLFVQFPSRQTCLLWGLTLTSVGAEAQLASSDVQRVPPQGTQPPRADLLGPCWRTSISISSPYLAWIASRPPQWNNTSRWNHSYTES